MTCSSVETENRHGPIKTAADRHGDPVCTGIDRYYREHLHNAIRVVGAARHEGSCSSGALEHNVDPACRRIVVLESGSSAAWKPPQIRRPPPETQTLNYRSDVVARKAIACSRRRSEQDVDGCLLARHGRNANRREFFSDRRLRRDHVDALAIREPRDDQWPPNP